MKGLQLKFEVDRERLTMVASYQIKTKNIRKENPNGAISKVNMLACLMEGGRGT